MTEASPTLPGDEGQALYIHWPFCLAKCPYCDFNSHVRDRIEQERWREGLLAELEYWAGETGSRRITSIFFGGGTPSLMEGATVAALIDRAARLWRLDGQAEITLEANPTSVEAQRFRDFRAAGVNRVSLGVQALDESALRFLGRKHSVAEALAAVELARKLFPRFSFDLIYARPGQDLAAWEAELDRALELAGSHLSVYQLTIEAGTAFATSFGRGDFHLPDEDLAGDLYEMTQAKLTDAGLPAYEISNHARPGEESRHNLSYWRYRDYVGVGPGAHGRLSLDGDKFATRQRKAPETWLAAVEAQGHGTEERLPLSASERLREMMMMGLRLAEPIPLQRFRAETGRDMTELLDTSRLESLIEGGFLKLDAQGLAATAEGRQRLDAVLAALLPDTP